MNFATFNLANNYLNAGNLTQVNYRIAAAAYLKAGDHIGHYQAYTRAHANTLSGLVDAIWNGSAHLAGALKLNHLSNQTDLLWRGTVKAQGEVRRVAERGVRSAYWVGVGGAGAGTCPSLDEYVMQHPPNGQNDVVTISKIHLKDYVTLLQALAAPHLQETVINRYNQSHKQAEKLRNEANMLDGALDAEILNHDGSYNGASAKWQRVEACANYWIQEIPAAAARVAARNAVEGWVAAGAREPIYRRVTAGEKDHVLANHVISQGEKSYERHKWFFFRDGDPGVDHPWELTINLRGQGIDFLLGHAIEVGDDAQKTSPHAFLTKGNEHDCIGIHEELLDVFFQHMVHLPITAKLTE
jgi:hypothetical protein